MFLLSHRIWLRVSTSQRWGETLLYWPSTQLGEASARKSSNSKTFSSPHLPTFLPKSFTCPMLPKTLHTETQSFYWGGAVLGLCLTTGCHPLPDYAIRDILTLIGTPSNAQQSLLHLLPMNCCRTPRGGKRQATEASPV